MRKKIGILLIISGLIGIILILAITNKDKISYQMTNIMAQIQSFLAQKEVNKEKEEGELPIKISYSDLSIDEKIVSITKNSDTKEVSKATGDGKLAKTEVHRKKDETTQVKIEYEIKVENKGNDSGTVESIIANLPSGMEVSKESSSTWKSGGKGTAQYEEEQEVKEGESKTIKLVLEGTASEIMGEQLTEVALLSSDDADQRIKEKDENKKIDESNVKDEMLKTNNYSSATAIISISTWLGDYSKYLILALIILITIGIIIYKAKTKEEKQLVTNKKVYKRVA